MIKNLYSKSLLIGVIAWFVCISLTGSTFSLSMNEPQMFNLEGNIFYVGGSGPGNYSSIQDAIDNASDGDTVFVFNDSSPYIEPDEIIIDKSIRMIGEDRNTTVITENIIIIRKSGVNVSGFTLFKNPIRGEGSQVSNIVISDNYFTVYGIYFEAQDNNTIISNSFDNCHIPIWILGKNNKISNNVFTYSMSDNWIEGEIYCEHGGKHVITNNIFINYNKEISRIGIHLEGASDCFIENNYFNGYENAIWLEDHANNNRISLNHIINNNNGFVVSFFSSSNRIKNNNFISNKRHAISSILSSNSYDSNYWDDWRGIQNPRLSFLPYFRFFFLSSIIDRYPAKEPYNYTIITHGCGIE